MLSGTRIYPSSFLSDISVGGDSSSDKIRSIREAFGVFEVLKLLTVLTCVAWTTWLIVVALAPNETANWLMGTGDYDNGQFWLIVDSNPSLTIAGAVGLAIVNACYLYVVVKTLRWRENHYDVASFHHQQPLSEVVSVRRSRWERVVLLYHRCRHLHEDLTAFNGRKRKYWNVCLKAFSLAMQTLVLISLLKSGSPAELVLGYATLVAVNAFSCAVNIICGKFSAVTEILIGIVFDWFAAVVHPILVLVYCYFIFNFDHAVFNTYLETLPPSSFEHQARVFADPSEVALFRLNFDSLRSHTLLDLALRIGMNLSFCYRLKRLGDELATTQHRTKGREQFQIAVPKAYATLFVVFSVVVWGYSYEAIADSRASCSVHRECVVFSYRRGQHGMCPCQIFIDADRAPSTYNEWLHPTDVFTHVKELAAAGELRTLQIINRQLLELPEELRRCEHLEMLELVYTSTQMLPSWTEEFKQLTFLHVEGKQGSRNLQQLPENLFSDMPQLAMVQLAVHTELVTFPPLNGVPNLQSLTLAWLLSLRELPSLDRVPQLKRLIIAIMPHFERIPDMTSQQNLAEFVITRPSHICCNGFRGECRLNDPSCTIYPMNTTPATCTNDKPFLGSSGTEAAFQAFAPTICQELPPDFNPLASIPTKEMIEMCEHRPFGQCHSPNGLEGVCYNTRMQVLACLPDQTYIGLRRYQIQQGIACNSSLESWLGCNQ